MRTCIVGISINILLCVAMCFLGFSCATNKKESKQIKPVEKISTNFPNVLDTMPNFGEYVPRKHNTKPKHKKS